MNAPHWSQFVIAGDAHLNVLALAAAADVPLAFPLADGWRPPEAIEYQKKETKGMCERDRS